MSQRYEAKEPTVQIAQEALEINNQHAYIAGATSQYRSGEGQPSAQRSYGGDAGGWRQSYSGGLYGYTDNSILHANNSRKYTHNNFSIGAIDQHFERIEDRKYSIQALKSIPGNSKCFDCAVEDPQWVNVNYAIILCAECAEIHHEHGLNIFPFVDGYLTKEQRVLVYNAGNKIASYYWMASWEPEYSEYLRAGSSREERRQYIVEKYTGKWVSIAEKAKIASAFNHAFYTYLGPQQPTIPFEGAHEAKTPEQIAEIPPQLLRATDQITHGMPIYVINNMTYRPRKVNGKNIFKR